MSKLHVRYCAGYNTSGTGQHEVLEYAYTQPSGNPELEEGPYVVVYTETPWAAEAIAAILNADGTDNNFPATPLSQAEHYYRQRFAKDAASSPPPPSLEKIAQDASGWNVSVNHLDGCDD